MNHQIEQLEHEAEAARVKVASSLDALREKLTGHEIVDEAMTYARQTRAGRLVERTTQNTLPVVALFAGIAWVCMAAALRSQRKRAADEGANSMISEAPGNSPDLLVSHEGWGVERVG